MLFWLLFVCLSLFFKCLFISTLTNFLYNYPLCYSRYSIFCVCASTLPRIHAEVKLDTYQNIRNLTYKQVLHVYNMLEATNQEVPFQPNHEVFSRFQSSLLLALGFSHPGLQKVTRPHGNAALVKSHPAREKSPGLC